MSHALTSSVNLTLIGSHLVSAIEIVLTPLGVGVMFIPSIHQSILIHAVDTDSDAVA